MPTNVIMPQMGESVAEGTVTRWFKKLGDRVERDETLFEISTDKVDAEIPSPAAGVLTNILVQENETVAVNTTVAIIDGQGAVPDGQAEVKAASEPEVEDAVPATPATQADGSTTPPAPPVAPAGQPAEVAGSVSAPSTSAPSLGPRDKTRSSPLVRRIAIEHNLDLGQIEGTGLGGRISKRDVLAHLAQQSQTPTPAPTLPAVGPAAPATAPGSSSAAPPPAAAPLATAVSPLAFTGPTQVVPMTPMRKQIAEHMVLSRRTSAHVSTVFEVEMTRVWNTRSYQADEFERRNGIKLTYTPFFVRAAVEVIKEFPILNSSVDGTNIMYRRDINIGLAVALETGLIVPVIKHADEKNFLGLARAVHDLAERARSKRLTVDDVQGGTFTVTNPGVFGSLFGTPIINQPQVAILGVGAIEKRAVVRDDAIAIRPMAYLSLSFDHRVVDGAVADQFMARLKANIEGWDEALL